MDRKKFDWQIFILLLILMTVGIISIYSASTNKIGDEFHTRNFYLKQILWIILSLFLMFLIIKIPFSLIEILIIPLYTTTILLLILVLFAPAIKGSHRWLMLGSIRFQPSELAKLSTVLMTAKLLSKPYLNDKQILLRSFSAMFLPVILILMEPDLGTAITLVISIFAILLVSELPNFYLILLVSPLFSVITSFSYLFYLLFISLLIYALYKSRLSGIIIAFAVVFNTFVFFITPVIWNGLKTYQQNRIISFLNPLHDPFGSGYQIIQSKIAIGSGRLFGKGFLLGTQKNMNFLPEHHTDFIFSVIGEEFGFLGCTIILILFFLFLMKIAKGIMVLKRVEMKFSAVGILSFLTFQIFINIGMNIGIVPTTGIPLPFISYGGSSLMINVLAVGLILKFLKERSIFE